MKSSYDDPILIEHNAEIIASCPIGVMRFVLAHEFQRLYQPGMRVLEIGCGAGNSAEPLLRLTDASMTLFDISPEMIARCKKRLAPYAHRLEYACEDALYYLEGCPQFHIITSSWTIHNFYWLDKAHLLSLIYCRLKKGGTFLLMDKVYPDNDGDCDKLLRAQIARYRYLAPEVAKAIIAHEEADAKMEYRMGEGRLLQFFKEIGFASAKIIDRCERDVVLVATK